jgi:hypothetical protein
VVRDIGVETGFYHFFFRNQAVITLENILVLRLQLRCRANGQRLLPVLFG